MTTLDYATVIMLLLIGCAGQAEGWVSSMGLRRDLAGKDWPRRFAAAEPIADQALQNTAVVFIKPHAVTDETISLVKAHLDAAGATIVREMPIPAEEIEERGLIDTHYGTLAELAMTTHPRDLEPSMLNSEVLEKFELTFGVPWDTAPLCTNADAPSKLGIPDLSGEDLETMWRKGPFVKLAPGTYVARLIGDDVPGLPQGDRPITLNGFYPAMREAFLQPGTRVHVLEVTFPETLSGSSGGSSGWAAFREDVVGATDPAKAAAGSLRAEILGRWEELGLRAQPSMALNGVHASAGPLEGLKERTIWCGLEDLGEDALGAALLACDGVDASALERWMGNPVVTNSDGGESDKIFDLTEGLDTSEVIALAPNLSM